MRDVSLINLNNYRCIYYLNLGMLNDQFSITLLGLHIAPTGLRLFKLIYVTDITSLRDFYILVIHSFVGAKCVADSQNDLCYYHEFSTVPYILIIYGSVGAKCSSRISNWFMLLS